MPWPCHRRAGGPLRCLVLLLACHAAPAAGELPAGLETTLSLSARFDVLANVAGGLETGWEAPGTVDAVGEIVYRPGGGPVHRARAYLLGTLGGDFSEVRGGDVQILSNLEAPDTVILYEAIYELEARSGAAAMLVGVHALDAEFNVLERGQLQVNSSFGTDPTLSQAMPSIFPVTAAGARLRLHSSGGGTLAMGVYDGTPGRPGDPYGTHIAFEDGGGVFAIAEASLARGAGVTGRKLALGAWHSTARFDDPLGRPRRANSGAYLIGERELGVLDGRLGVFGQLGIARGDRNVFTGYLGGGLHLVEPLGRVARKRR